MSNTVEFPAFLRDALPDEEPVLPADFGVGSPVVVILPRYSRTNPEPVPAVVTEKARVWIRVRTTDNAKRFPTEWRFRLDNQSDGLNSNYKTYFRTPDQHAYREAIDAASGYLRDQGLSPDFSSPWREKSKMVQLAQMVWMLQNQPTN